MTATAMLLTAASSVGFLGWWDDYCDDMSVGLKRRLAGEVVVPSDNATYESAVHQYAFSNDPSRMRPSGVVFPANDRDVKRAVRYAGICDYRVTVRSGGHQYMGLSSCDSTVHKCMQIDMSHYKNMSIDGTTVTVGAGVSLAEMYNTLAQHGLFLGAGECGTVNVGGHVQTGGYGLLGRSFGALADQVTSFTIILAGGRKKLIPRPGSPGSTKRKNDLFWAVLGGGAGSWGVVTEYTFEAHRDVDYTSTYWNCMVPYSKAVFEDMAGAFEAVSSAGGWDANHQEALWMTTVKRSPFDSDFIHIEAAWAGLGGAAFDDSNYQTFVQAVNGRGLCTAFPANLSTVLTQFTTFYGEREFPFPYEKRNRITRAASMGPTFKGTLADQMDAAMAVPGMFFFSQLVTIGGKMLDLKGGEIALPLRDARVNLDIAAFYSTMMNPAAKEATTQYQDAAWAALVQDVPAFSEDLRYVWANWGNVNIEEVHQKYYEDETYERLREIKKDVDLLNTFRTTFTIPPEDCEWDDVFDGW